MNSILHQTFQDFEIILLDDASTDNSRDVIELYRKNHKLKAIVYNDKNSGSPFFQWAKGIEMAGGDWIWIAESDDDATPEFLVTFFAFMHENNGIVLGYSSPCWINDFDEQIHPPRYRDPNVFDGNEFIPENLFKGNRLENASAIIFRREVAMLYKDQLRNFRLLGDWWFWLKLVQHGKLLQLPGGLCNFRRHGKAVSAMKIFSNTWKTEFTEILSMLTDERLIHNNHVFARIIADIGQFPNWEHELSDNQKRNFISFWTGISQQWELGIDVKKEVRKQRFKRKMNQILGKFRSVAKRIKQLHSSINSSYKHGYRN